MADYDATPDASAAPHPDSILRLASAVHRFSIVSTTFFVHVISYALIIAMQDFMRVFLLCQCQ